MRGFIVLFVGTALCFYACRQNPNPPRHAVPAPATLESRERLIGGDVENRWVRVNDDADTVQPFEFVRFIFYRNYNVTTFGREGSRQGHWAVDNDTTLSFHFDGADSLRIYTILELDTNALRLRDAANAVAQFHPE